MLGLWPGLVILVHAVLVTGVKSAPKAGDISCHWLAADAAELHYSLGNALKIKSLVQLDRLEIVQHVRVLS